MLSFVFLLLTQLCSCSVKKSAMNEPEKSNSFAQKLGSLASPSFDDYSCSNISPISGKGCNQLAQEGICELMDASSCALSCQTCCVDIEPDGMSCADISGLQNGCDYFVKQGYCLSSCNACHKLMEIYALSSLQTAIQYPDQLSSWTGWDPCDNWDGVTCQNGKISQLNLGGEYFDFSINDWQGTSAIIANAATTIPAELSCLEDLNDLWIASTGFSGTLPPEFSTFTALKSADFLSVVLSGSIPPQYSTWNSFYAISICNNALTSTIPAQFSTWDNMHQFYVWGNQISGFLPQEFSKWQNVSHFVTYDNQLTGQVPLEFSKWKNIGQFDVCDGDGNDVCIQDYFYGSEYIVKNCPLC